MANETILVVDADTKSQKVLEVSFKKAGYRVLISDSVEEAKRLIEQAHPDLIISDTTLPDGDGFEFCAQLKQDDELGKLPFVFLTEERSLPQKMKGFELGADEYLTKPIYIKEVTSRVDVLLQKQAQRALSGGDVESFAGDLADITMIDLLQTIEQELRTGTIRIERNHRDGFVYFREGNILDATCGKLQGEEALYRLMLWPNGKFEVKYHDEVERADHIEKDSGDLLIEGIQRLERWNELVDDVPQLGRVFEADYHSLPDLLEQLPDEAGRVVRLFDGMRNLRDVIDDSPFDDVTTLQIVSRLFQEDVLTQTEQEETESIRTTANLQAWLDGPKGEGSEKMPFSQVDADDDDKDPLSDTSPGVADAFNYEDENSEAFEEQTRPAQDSHPPLGSSDSDREKSRTKTSSGLGTVSRESEPTQWKVHWDEDEAPEGEGPKSVEDIEEMEKRRREEEARQIIRQSGQFNATQPQVMAVSRDEGEVDEADATAGAEMDDAERRRREAEARQLQEQAPDAELADAESTPTVSTEDESQRESMRESTQELVAETPEKADRERKREPTPIAGPGVDRSAATPVSNQTSPGNSVQDVEDDQSETAPADQTSPGIQITDTSAIPDAMTDDQSVDFDDGEQAAAPADASEEAQEEGDEHDVDDVPSSSEMRAASVEEADAVSREAGESMRRSAPFAAVTEDEADADAQAREAAQEDAPAEQEAEQPGRRERRVTQEVSTSAVDSQVEPSEPELDEEPAEAAAGLDETTDNVYDAAGADDADAGDDADDSDEGTIEPFIAAEHGDDERLGVEPTPTYDESSDGEVAAAATTDEDAGELFEMAEAVEGDDAEEPADIEASAVEELGPEAEIAVERSAKDRELVTAEYDLSKKKKAGAVEDTPAVGTPEEDAEDGQAEAADAAADEKAEDADAAEDEAEEADEVEDVSEDEATGEDASDEDASDEDAEAADAAPEEEGEDEPEESAEEESEEEAEEEAEGEADAAPEEEAEDDAEEERDAEDKAAAAADMSKEEIALSDHSHEASFFDEGEDGEFDYQFEDVPETSGRWKHFVTVAVIFGLVAVVLVVYSNMSDSSADKTGGETPVVADEKASEKTAEVPEETVEVDPEPEEAPDEAPFDPTELGVDAAAAPDVAMASAANVEQAATRQAEMFAMVTSDGADAGQASADAGTTDGADAGTEPTQVAANTTDTQTEPTNSEPEPKPEPEPEPEPKPEPKASASVDQAQTLLRRGKTRQALDMLESLSSSKPNSGEVAFYRGKAAYQMGRNSDAIEQFNRAINLGYTRASVYSELGSAYMVQGQRGKAKKAYQKYLEKQPEGKTADEIRSVIKNL